MKPVNVAEATGPALNWAVATCEGYSVAVSESGEVIIIREGVVDYFDPHHNWGWGGPIIEREGVNVGTQRNEPGLRTHPDRVWHAQLVQRAYVGYGPTPLIAAMRCYVASQLGDTVEVPEELVCPNT